MQVLLAEQLATKRECRSACFLNKEVVLDKRSRRAVPVNVEDAQPALIVAPGAYIFVHTEPLPIHVIEFDMLEHSGLSVRRPPSQHAIKHSILNVLFKDADLDEAATQLVLRRALEESLKPADTHFIEVREHLSLREFASSFVFKLAEVDCESMVRGDSPRARASTATDCH